MSDSVDSSKISEIPVYLQEIVGLEIRKWEHWVAKWKLGAQRTNNRVCRRCTGSPLVQAAGITLDTPHQVTHALISRMHKIIDGEVDRFTQAHLPALAAELEQEKMWKKPGFDPNASMPVEVQGMDVDPLPDSPEQPFLFTLEELADDVKEADFLPRPPLTQEEKVRLKIEIEKADRAAINAGQAVCFALTQHRADIAQTIARFVEPQVQELLNHMLRGLTSI